MLTISPAQLGDLALAVAAVVQLTKFLLSYMVKPTDANAANFVRLYVYLISAGVCLLYLPLSSDIATSAKLVLSATFQAGTSAIVLYHLLNGLSPVTALLPGLAPSIAPATADPTVTNEPHV